MSKPYTVTVVCTGNICRSPIAEVLLREAFSEAGLDDRVQVGSAGTGDWHLGHDMDHRARAVLEGAGHSFPVHSARQFLAEAFTDSDLILAADVGHYRDLVAMAPDEQAAERVHLFRSFDEQARVDADLNLADPYYGDERDFTLTYQAVTAAVPGVVEYVRGQLP
ncbi:MULTISPECIES: low molecular weight protein-tyrosine-phosphatase [unclassified Pseudactinotalea]|uniref:low molecular weight protein-tyrosine-phosphatase n=1 Tax=Micrococcales TaxID=85006 RepID=UPI003C7E3F7D